METVRTVLTIAGSDCSGGAGIQADIKTITVHKMYAMSVITALTSQNTVGVSGIFDVSSDFVASQIDSVFTDIRPDAVKIGMLSNPEIIKVVAEKLIEYKAQNIVIDPVMVSTSGKTLLQENAENELINSLLPIGTLITPNMDEAAKLCGFKVGTKEDMVKAAEVIFKKIKVPVLIKGGHLETQAADLLYEGNNVSWFINDRIDNPNTHGTGCTLSSAIACNLAKGQDLEDSIEDAKQYLTNNLKKMFNLGKGSGPMKHW